MLLFCMVTYLDSLLALPTRATRTEWASIATKLALLESTVNHKGSFWSQKELARLAKALATAQMMAE